MHKIANIKTLEIFYLSDNECLNILGIAQDKNNEKKSNMSSIKYNKNYCNKCIIFGTSYYYINRSLGTLSL